MTKQSLKLGIKTSIGCITFLTLSLLILSQMKIMPKAGSSHIYYITVSVGETYESAGINYHCDSDNSYVIYGTSSTLSTFTKVDSTSTLWSIEQSADDPETGFGSRYVCKANLTKLEASTKYYYQIIAGSEKSDILYFTTPNLDGTTSFLFLTDTQSAGLSTFQKVDTLVQAIEKKERNLNMVLMTGDIVDRGGYSAQWDAFFKGMPTLQKYQQATIPGNHEYYHDNKPGYIDASFYNQFYNNPLNGPTDRQNSSYYFVYGDALIIMLDTICKDNIDLDAQRAWFKQVVENNPTRWIIVGSHAGAISAGVYASDAKYMMNNWGQTFEECQVDLAISGHEHIYIRKELMYQGTKNEELGVTYLVGPASGQKDYAAQSTEGFDEVLRGNYRGQVIKMQGDKMMVTLYDTTGTAITSFTLNAKRNAEPEQITDQEILDSITYQYHADTTSLDISWNPNIWGIVKKVSCSGDDQWSQTVPSISTAFATKRMFAVYNDRVYHFTISFEKMDNTVIQKELTLVFNDTLKPTQINVTGKNRLNIGETSQLSADITPSTAVKDVRWESSDPSIASVDENGVVTAIAEGRTTITVTSMLNPSVKALYRITVSEATNPTTLTISNIPSSFNINDVFTLSVTVTPSDASPDVAWSSSNESVAYVTEDGEVHIVGYGTVTIKATSLADETISDEFTFTLSETTKNGCSCKKGMEYIITLTSLLCLGIVVYRKKR